MTAFQSFISKQLLLAALLAAISIYVFGRLDDAFQTQAWPFILIFFVFVNSFLFYLNQRAQKKKLSAYTNYFMLASFSKLLLNLVVIVVYLLYFRSEAIPFLITFLIYYVAFTTLEITTTALKKKKQHQANQ